LLSVFKSEKEFAKFAAFIDVKSYLTQLRDHELSLVSHSNLDYSTATVDKTRDLF
jgi:hypothetical protein